MSSPMLYRRFDELPPELLVIIFKYVGKQMTKLKRVCRIFNLVIKENSQFLPKIEIEEIFFAYDCCKHAVAVDYKERRPDRYNNVQLVEINRQLPVNFLANGVRPRLSELLRHFVLNGILEFGDLVVDDRLVAELLQPHLNLFLTNLSRLDFTAGWVLMSASSMKSLLANVTKNSIDIRFLHATLEVNPALFTDDTFSSVTNLSSLVVTPSGFPSYDLASLTDATLLRLAQQKPSIHHFVFGSEMTTGFTINGIIPLVKAWQKSEVSKNCIRLLSYHDDMTVWNFGRISSTKKEFRAAFQSLSKVRKIYYCSSALYEATAIIENDLDDRFELHVTCSLVWLC